MTPRTILFFDCRLWMQDYGVVLLAILLDSRGFILARLFGAHDAGIMALVTSAASERAKRCERKKPMFEKAVPSGTSYVRRMTVGAVVMKRVPDNHSKSLPNEGLAGSSVYSYHGVA